MKKLFFIPLLLSSPAWAQSSLDVFEDEVIIQGIYDRDISLEEVAASVAVLGVEDLQDISFVHPAEALNAIAGVNIHRGSGQEHLTAIRSPVLTGGAGAASFLYLQDGVPLRAAGFANVNGLFEGGTEFAEQLEVFRGPGPAEFGSNAVHGLINIQSQDVASPTRIRLLGSSDGFAGFTAAHSAGDFRVAVTANHDNGFRDDSGFDQQKIQLKYQGQFGVWDVKWLTSFQNLNQETAGFLQDIDEGPQGEELLRDEDIRFSNPNPEAFRDSESYRTQASFTRDIGADKTLKLTPYARRSELRFLRHFVPGQALEKNSHTSVGLQSALFSDDWNIGADVEYTQGKLLEFQENSDALTFNPAITFTQGLHYDYEVESFVGAAYAQKNFWLSPQTVFDIGTRAEYTRYEYDNQTTEGRLGRFIRLADRTDDFFVITPKASLRHEVSDNLNIYARGARGARAPQTVDLYSVQLNQTGGEADVETLDSLEAGLKFDNEVLSFEAAAFSQWKDNFFFRNSDGFSVANGRTKHIGIEASFLAKFTDWLSLSGDGTLARHTYDFDDVNLNLDGLADESNTITDGDRVDTAPDTLVNLRLTARTLKGLTAEVEWSHVSSYFTDPGNTQSYDGHNVFVLRSSFDITNNLRIFGRVDNLFDEIYADRADFAFGNERFFPGRPRTVFFGLSSEF